MDIKRNDDSFSIHISQCGQRTISVSSDAKYGDILHVYYNIVTLCMLFDGQFFPTVEADDGVGITWSWNERTLPSFTSADFLIGMNSKLIEFDSAISNTVLEKWDIMFSKTSHPSDVRASRFLLSGTNMVIPLPDQRKRKL